MVLNLVNKQKMNCNSRLEYVKFYIGKDNDSSEEL